MTRVQNKKENTPINYAEVWKKRYENNDIWDKKRFLSLMEKVKDGERIVELGCGCMRFLEFVKQTFPKCEVHGLDFCPYAIELMSNLNPQIRYKLGDALSTGYPDNYFDVTVAGEMIEHFESSDDLLKEMLRITKPGGWISISTPNDELNIRGFVDAYHLWTFTQEDIEQMLKKYCKAIESTIVGLYIIAHGCKPASPKISIIIPNYNYGNYLIEAVESVVQQTYQDFEIIIVDDGSDDGSAEISYGLIKKYPMHKIQYIFQRNGGSAMALNSGIRLSTGEYILRLDADDKLEPTALKKMIKVLDTKQEVSVVYGDIARFGEVDKVYRNNREFNIERLKECNYISSFMLYRRKVWGKVGGYDEKMRWSEDDDFLYSCIEAKFKFEYIPEILFFYRKHKESKMYNVTRIKDRPKWIVYIRTKHKNPNYLKGRV